MLELWVTELTLVNVLDVLVGRPCDAWKVWSQVLVLICIVVLLHDRSTRYVPMYVGLGFACLFGCGGILSR